MENEEKTVLEWLEQLPEPYRSQAIENYDPNFKSIHDANPVANAIRNAFSWAGAEHGYDYWADIHTRAERGEFDAPVDPIPWPEEAKWENAPEGTFARAVDENGQCCFYIMQQSYAHSPGNVWAGGYKYCGKIPDMTGVDWKQTLQFKPK